MAETERYADAGHLPKRRPDGTPAAAHTLPRQRRGITPQMIGRYPDFDVLDAAGLWDEATRTVVLQRLDPPKPLRFFNAEQEPVARAFCDTVTAQDRDPRVPVTEMVDGKMAERRFDGYRHEGLPDDDETWRIVVAGLDEVARRRYGQPFAQCGEEAREAICDQFSKGALAGGVWDTIDSKKAWSVCTRAILSAFYSHPWAWNEIGFGGPAYPRGYLRLGAGLREPHEKPEAVHDDPVREEASGDVP